MTGRNPLAVGHLTTAAVIAEARLKDAPVSPAARVAGARAIAAAMTPAERAGMAQRNAARMAEARARVNASDAAVGAVLHACPRCGAEARGKNDGQRADWFASHYNSAHGGHRG